MNKRYIILFFFLIFSEIYVAQNLVPNPSFEDTISNPNWNAVIQGACTDWFGPLPASTDYWSNLNPLCFNCASLIQVPRTGYAYAGIHTFDSTSGVPIYYREGLSVKLLDTLKEGKTYCVSFYVSRNEEFNYSCNSIGVFFSSFPITNSDNIINYFPQITNSLSNNLIDSNGWTRVSGSFAASGGELYLTIANFSDNANSDTIYIGGGISNQKIAYYFIDDVSVYECDDTTTNSSLTIPNVFTPNRDGINDYFQVTDTAITTFSCHVFNRWGNEVYSSDDIDKPWNGKTKDGKDCSEGTYYYVISATGEDGKQYLKKGFVMLMR